MSSDDFDCAELLTTAQAAELLGVTRDSVRQMAHRGTLTPATDPEGSTVRAGAGGGGGQPRYWRHEVLALELARWRKRARTAAA